MQIIYVWLIYGFIFSLLLLHHLSKNNFFDICLEKLKKQEISKGGLEITTVDNRVVYHHKTILAQMVVYMIENKGEYNKAQLYALLILCVIILPLFLPIMVILELINRIIKYAKKKWLH